MILSVFLFILSSIVGFFIIFGILENENNKFGVSKNERRLLLDEPYFLRKSYIPSKLKSGSKKYCDVSSKWPSTVSNSTVLLPCPSGFVGFAYRYCTIEGEWKSSNYLNCFPNKSKEISSNLYNRIIILKEETNRIQYKQPDQYDSAITDDDIHSFYYPPLDFTEKQNIGRISPVMNLGSALISYYTIEPSKMVNDLSFDRSSGNITGIAIETGTFTYNVTAFYIDEKNYTMEIKINITPLKCSELYISEYDYWNSTDVGSIGYNYCRKGYMGFRKRLCLKNAVWDRNIDETDCKELDYSLEPDSSSVYIHYTLFIVDFNYTIVNPNVLFNLNKYIVSYCSLEDDKSIYLEDVKKVENPIYSGVSSSNLVTNYTVHIQSYSVKIRIEIKQERLNDFDKNFSTNITSNAFYDGLCEFDPVFTHSNIQHMSHDIVERKKKDYTLLIIIIVVVVIIIVVITAAIIFERYRRTHVKHIDIFSRE